MMIISYEFWREKINFLGDTSLKLLLVGWIVFVIVFDDDINDHGDLTCRLDIDAP